MDKAVKIIAGGLIIFCVSVLVLTGILTASQMIRKDLMRENMESSAETLCGRKQFFRLWEEAPGSMIDRYADSILLSIAYQTDQEHPLTATMWSAYYHDDLVNENENLLLSVQEDLSANMQYLRYWHGSAVFVRIFHLFTDIKGMYIFNAVLLAVLFTALTTFLWKSGMRGEAVGLVISAALIHIWFVPFCLEYYWMFLLMCPVSAVALCMGLSGKWDRIWMLFLLSGIMTAYLDFLTTETLTLMIPLIILITVYRKKEEEPALSAIKRFAATSCISWVTGYAGMWGMKWLIASLVTGENVMPYVTEHIAERIGVGDVATSSMGTPLTAVARNFSCIWSVVPGGRVFFIIFMIVFLCFMYAYRKHGIRWDYVALFALVGIIPYVRYLVLHNHSFLHYFFTYRAQMGTIFAFGMTVTEVVDGSLFAYGRKKKKQNR